MLVPLTEVTADLGSMTVGAKDVVAQLAATHDSATVTSPSNTLFWLQVTIPLTREEYEALARRLAKSG